MTYIMQEDSRLIDSIKKDIERTEMIIRHTKKTVALKQNHQKLKMLNHALRRAIWNRNKFELFELIYNESMKLFAKEVERFANSDQDIPTSTIRKGDAERRLSLSRMQ